MAESHFPNKPSTRMHSSPKAAGYIKKKVITDLKASTETTIKYDMGGKRRTITDGSPTYKNLIKDRTACYHEAVVMGQ